MSEENAEKIRAFWEAWTPGGEMDLSILDAEVVYEDTTLPDHIGEQYRGHQGIARATGRWLEPYESMSVELDRIVGTGDRLVSIHRARAKARYTGIEEEARSRTSGRSATARSSTSGRTGTRTRHSTPPGWVGRRVA